MLNKKEKNNSIFDTDGIPPILKSIPLSLQHLLAMIVGTVTAPIIVAGVVGASPFQSTLLVQYALIIAGITTLIQLYPIGKMGARLPIIFGVGFTYLPTLVAIGSQFGLKGILGAQIIGGIATIIVGIFIKKIRRFFPTIVAGTVVLTIGLSLYPIAINYMAGGVGSESYGSITNWSIAIITLLVVIGVSQFAKGYIKSASIFVGIIVGYAISMMLGIVDFTPVKEAAWFALPKPLQFGVEFHATAIISMVVISIVNAIQTIGDLSATTMGGLNREITDDELSGGVLGSGVCTVIGALFGGLPTSSYSQNVGIVAMNKVVSRFVLGIAAAFMLLAGFVPKFGALMTTIPRCVLGGATITVFSMITMTGIKLVIKDELSSRNITIVGLAIAMGMGVTTVPESLVSFPDWAIMIFAESPIVIATIIAFTLNIVLPHKSLADEEKERIETQKQEGLGMSC